MTTPERPMPPLDADERTTLEAWLDFYRATLATKCACLAGEQLRTASAPPSRLTLQGWVQQGAGGGGSWSRRVPPGERAPPIFDSAADPDGRDEGFDLSGEVPFADALATWEAEVAQARANCA